MIAFLASAWLGITIASAGVSEEARQILTVTILLVNVAFCVFAGYLLVQIRRDRAEVSDWLGA